VNKFYFDHFKYFGQNNNFKFITPVFSRSASGTIAQSGTETTCNRDYLNIPGAANVSQFKNNNQVDFPYINEDETRHNGKVGGRRKFRYSEYF